MKSASTESGVLPAHDATERLRSLLHPGLTVYLIQRHISRSGAQGEVSLLLITEPPRRYEPRDTDTRLIIRDLSSDVADVLHGTLGPAGGVLVRRLAVDEYGAWVIRRLDELCGFTHPQTALKFRWL